MEQVLDGQFPEFAIGHEFSENLLIALHAVDHEALEGFLEDVAEVVLGIRGGGFFQHLAFDGFFLNLVEAVSNSTIWPKTAIFVVEDDAQSGVDHVDGHRTVAMVISPYTRGRKTDSTFYTTINLYRTIEQLLGLPPTNQFDLAADPMFTVFTPKPGLDAFKALPNRVPLDEMNPPLKALNGKMLDLARASQAMDFDEPDAAPEALLNQAIWHSVKGPLTPYPNFHAVTC